MSSYLPNPTIKSADTPDQLVAIIQSMADDLSEDTEALANCETRRCELKQQIIKFGPEVNVKYAAEKFVNYTKELMEHFPLSYLILHHIYIDERPSFEVIYASTTEDFPCSAGECILGAIKKLPSKATVEAMRQANDMD